MGVVCMDFRFEGRTPLLEEICEQITVISGLPIVVHRQGTDEVHSFFGDVAFRCQPDTRLEISAYDRDVVRRNIDEWFQESSHSTLMNEMVTGANAPAGTQTIHLQGSMGQEPTLLMVTALALEMLGGESRSEISDEDRSDFGQQISEAALAQRHQRTSRQIRTATILCWVTLPLWLPVWILGMLWFVLCLPWQIWRGIQAVKQLENDG